MYKRQVCTALVLLTALANLSHAAADDDRWYTVEMFGGRAGWMHVTQKTEGETITSETAIQFSLKRGAVSLDISMESRFVETADGKPVSMRSTQKFGAEPMVQDFTFKDEGVELVTTQNGQSRTSMLAKPEGTWLTPAAAERYVLQRFKSGAQEIVVRSVDPFTGVEPVSSTRTGFEKTTVMAMGRTIDATKVTVEVSNFPGVKSAEFVDGEGALIRSETSMGGMKFNTIAATKEEALADAVAPEVMVGTLVKPDRPIPNPRQATHAVYLLSVPEGPMPPIPPTGAQRIDTVDERTLRVTVLTTNPGPAGDDTSDVYLRASGLADSEDEKIQSLTKRATAKSGEDPSKRAEDIRRFVYRYVKKKNLGVGFASATEVAQTREGDCTEHGVLLTAMLRANGIPARAVTGLLYVDEFAGEANIFGYHMWAQALLTIDGQARWVDLDGTLPPATPFYATHIALATSDLADGDMVGSVASIATLMGRLDIKVESVK